LIAIAHRIQEARASKSLQAKYNISCFKRIVFGVQWHKFHDTFSRNVARSQVFEVAFNSSQRDKNKYQNILISEIWCVYGYSALQAN
jgi:hypothetical protein